MTVMPSDSSKQTSALSITGLNSLNPTFGSKISSPKARAMELAKLLVATVLATMPDFPFAS